MYYDFTKITAKTQMVQGERLFWASTKRGLGGSAGRTALAVAVWGFECYSTALQPLKLQLPPEKRNMTSRLPTRGRVNFAWTVW